MIYIAHRGLIDGPNTELENNPEHIDSIVKMGYDAEIDLWAYEIDGKYQLLLGHDEGKYQVDYHWLAGKPLWIHAKNLASLHWLTKHKRSFNYFWHQNDEYTLTSEGFIWTYPYKELTENSICVQPEWNPDINLREFNPICYGICSKYVSIIKQNHK